VVVYLGISQTLAWASSYYLPAVLATPMARDIGVSAPTIFAAFSMAMIVSALIGPWAGRIIDRLGGRPVLIATNVLFATGLGALALATDPVSMFSAWLLIGAAMGAGLYEAAFASLVRLYGHNARGSITGVTLIAGFASTIGWPLTAWMESQYGWRGACLGWATLHMVAGLPLNALLPRDNPEHGHVLVKEEQVAAPAAVQTSSTSAMTTALLAFVFAATWFSSTAMAAHLPRMLQAAGASLAVAVSVGALVGPAQVIGRLVEFGVLRRVHPLLSARIAASAHPLGVALLLFLGPVAAPVFAGLHGAGNGILTIAKGTLPLVLFGPSGYGARQGWLMMPARIAQAGAPLLFGLALDHWGVHALILTMVLGLLALASLLVLQASGHTNHAVAEAP